MDSFVLRGQGEVERIFFMRKHLMKASLLVFLALVLAGCGSLFQPQPTPTPTLDPDSPEITITMDEFRFEPDHIRLVVGQKVTLHVINTGQEDHEIMIGRNPLRAEDGDLGDGFEHDFFALTDVTVQGDVEVMGMNGEEMNMDSMDSMDMGTATPEGGMEMGDEMSSADEHAHEGEMVNGGMVMIQPEKEATITFTVTKEMTGAWTIGCFEGGNPEKHFDLGMAGILYVRNFDD
jgi:plastocyanin